MKSQYYLDNLETGLNLSVLRKINMARVEKFKNRDGSLAHSKSLGMDWSPAQWLQAMVGELGEYANVRKKFERGELSWDEYIKAAHEELADTLIYLDILAFHAGVDLSEATIEKFNSVSDRIGESGLKLFTSTLRRGDE